MYWNCIIDYYIKVDQYNFSISLNDIIEIIIKPFDFIDFSKIT